MEVLALLVEGDLDEAVGHRIVAHTGGTVVNVYGRNGINYIKSKLAGFNQFAQGVPILTLADLMDTGFDCPVEALEAWLPHPHDNMLFRLVVREIESWILADRARVARGSRFKRIRRLIVPALESTAQVGPAYTSEMQRFVYDRWRIDRAMERAPSLRRCVHAVNRFLNS